jgi:two-component system CheB/CheR fusion protein
MNFKELFIVGIGASAGGFEALQKFLSKIKMDDRITYVITQHLDSKKPTLLGELLSKYSGIQISAINDGEEIKGNHIYYCPPNVNLIIKNKKFLLLEPENKPLPKPSIDIFFKSLAIEKKDKAIAIILSGTGSDGTEGIIEVENNGGITLTEDEGAKYFSMPKSAIDSGKVLASLPPELLAEGIINIIEDRKYFDKYFEIEDSLEKIFNILRDETSVDFSSYKQATVTRRIKKRIIERKSEGVNEYIKLLQTDKEEVSKLKDELLIVVTSFFRDEDAFIDLKKELTLLIEKKLDNNIRIWVTACATGEEAYSIAMITNDILEELNISKKVTIFATDISDKVIIESRNRVFKSEELLGIRKGHLEKYFEKTQKLYKINKRIRDMIVFSKHDIIKDPPFLNLDMISCRNLLIYFNTELQKRILSIFYYSLRYESLLFLGKSETIGTLTSLFSIVNNKSKIYKKLNDLAKVDIETLTYGKRNSTFSKSNYINNQSSNLMDIDISINKSISNRFVQNGIVVGGTNYNILFYKGDCKEFLHHPQGIHTNDLFRLLVDFLRLDVRATINEAKKNGHFHFFKKN